MGLKRQIERLRKWACSKAKDGCCAWCNFSIDDGDYFSHHYYCAIKDLYTFREPTDEACEEWKDGN